MAEGRYAIWNGCDELDRAIVKEMDACIERFIENCGVYVYAGVIKVTNDMGDSIAAVPLVDALARAEDRESATLTIEAMKAAIQRLEDKLNSGELD